MTATSEFLGPLANDLAAYVDRLQSEGRALRSPLIQLHALDRLTLITPLQTGSVDEAFAKAWLAPLDGRGPNTRRGRYFLLRGFCRFLARSRPQTFVPGPSLCPRRRPAPPPHIYTPQQVRLLLDGALRLSKQGRAHLCPFRSETMHTLLLLLATTGMRISEVLQLTLKDLDLDQGVLSVRQSKFRKSRLIPVSEGMLLVLRQYLQRRLQVAEGHGQAPLFVSGRGQRYSYSCVAEMFRRIVREAQIGSPTQPAPRLHDFRHSFAVTRLLLWYREGSDVMARLPLLSTYLGHAQVRDTQVYLQATADLLAEAARRYHHFASDLLPGGGPA